MDGIPNTNEVNATTNRSMGKKATITKMKATIKKKLKGKHWSQVYPTKK